MSGERTSSPPATRRLVPGPCKEATVVAATVALLVGCGGEEPAPPATEARPGVGEVTTGADGVQEITLQTQDDYLFLPDSFTVDPGTVRLTVTNVGEEMVHNFRFMPGEGPEDIGAQIDLLAAGEEETIEFEVTQPCEHPFECTFHVQLDQVGTMTVRG